MYDNDFMMNGMRFVSRPGRCDGDEKLCIGIVQPGKLLAVEMCHVAVITHRVCRNEEFKYPKERGFLGDDMFLEFLKCAAKQDPVLALSEYGLPVPSALRQALAVPTR